MACRGSGAARFRARYQRLSFSDCRRSVRVVITLTQQTQATLCLIRLPMALIGVRTPATYGLPDTRMLAWAGVYVDAKRSFRESERAALIAVAAQPPLKSDCARGRWRDARPESWRA